MARDLKKDEIRPQIIPGLVRKHGINRRFQVQELPPPPPPFRPCEPRSEDAEPKTED